MKILMVYPQNPDTFWSFKHVLRFVSKRSTFPPLGLLTVAAMLPADWEVKVMDLNVERLKESDLRWADFVMLSAMIVHTESVNEIVARCDALRKADHRRRPPLHHRPPKLPLHPAFRPGRGRRAHAPISGRHAVRHRPPSVSRHRTA